MTWQGKRISVILPTYNERDSIRTVICDFVNTGVVDEVLVVNNNAALGTSEEVEAAARQASGSIVRESFEARQDYGAAIQHGFREATGDYLVVCEPDGTFLARDIFKLLGYAEDFKVVYGTRTARMLIWRGANMGVFLRWGNWAVAKLMEFLFNSTNLTDVGCTMRLIRREALREIESEFTIDGSAFGPEMMLLSLLHGHSVIQVPVNYLPRVGQSSVTGDIRKTVPLGLWMIALIVQYRFRASPTKRRSPRTRNLRYSGR
jgi:glycosyltransferase involved in cell wall biosynthesis